VVLAALAGRKLDGLDRFEMLIGNEREQWVMRFTARCVLELGTEAR
jgi:hypothetical protein